jgi:acetyl esterase/lipase
MPRYAKNQIFALFTAALLLGAQEPQSAASPAGPLQTAPEPNESVTVEGDVPYGMPNGQKLCLDIYKPSGQTTRPRPGVVLIHGGGWTSLDKSTMRGMGQFLARLGFVVFSVDYRLLRGTENRWPAQLDDVQRSARWMRANASKYNVDPDHIGAFGHSAGAQLAALLGMEESRDKSDPALAKYSSRVQAVVDVSGPSDFTKDHDPEGVAFPANLLGGDSSSHPDIWRDASPIFHVSKTSAPFLIVHGTRDENVRSPKRRNYSKRCSTRECLRN